MKTKAPVPRRLKQVLDLLYQMKDMKLGRLEQLFEWTTRRSEIDQVNNFFLVTLGALCDPDRFEQYPDSQLIGRFLLFVWLWPHK